MLGLLEKEPQRRLVDAYTVYERLLPFLPVPGANVEPGELYLLGLAGPTRIFRRPNAPLETTQVEPTRTYGVATEPTAPLTAQHLDSALDNARRRYDELLGTERFAQAADALAAVLDNVAGARGQDSPDVLALRRDMAAAWALGGESRRARAELESLAEAYRRVEGRFSESAWEAKAIAARCRMNLGDIDGGLTVMRGILAEVVAANSDSCELALEMRCDLAEILAGIGDHAGALELLEALYTDLCVLRGVDDPMTFEVDDLRNVLLSETAEGRR